MRRVVTLSFILTLLMSSTAHAAFVTCEDARQYGENSARLYVGQSFARIACNADLLGRVHLGLDRLLARQVLRTSDSDEEKACFYQGLLFGLLDQLRIQYAACTCDARFACVSGEVVSSHVGSLVSALTLSLAEPASFGNDGLTALVAASVQAAALPQCDASVDACTQSLLQSLSQAAEDTFPQSAESLGELLCAPPSVL